MLRPLLAPAGGPRGGRAAACLFLALVLGVLLPGDGLSAPAPPRAIGGPAALGENQVHYEIEARLEADSFILHGSQRVTWTNGSADEVSDLWFHTYLNAFSNTASTHLTESGGKLRGVEMTSDWGWARIERVELAEATGDVELTESLAWHAPDDGNPDDRTVFSVDLPRAVAPGETIVVRVQWESKLPRVRRRVGFKDDFILAAHWFPKLGVYQEGSGWNCHQFHRDTEFFSDYGTYEVTLDLPERYEDKVGGSGILARTRKTGQGRIEVTFEAPSEEDRAGLDRTGKVPAIHAFTWTADPKFEVHEFTFSWADWKLRFPEEVEEVQEALGDTKDITLRDVQVTVLIQPERADQAERHFDATAAALFFYGLWFGEYPYEHITVVDPPWGGGAAGGMEYPTIFTCGTSMGTEVEMHRPESVTVHECGHQFFYGLVGTNEFEHAWMDEGFNSYADSEVLWRQYGPSRASKRYSMLPIWGTDLTPTRGGGDVLRALSGQRLQVDALDLDVAPLGESGFLDWWRDQPLLTLSPERTDPRWSDRRGYLSDPDSDPVDRFAWTYHDRGSYRCNSYPRPAVVMRSLEGLVGRDTFLRGMRTYAETWRYRHPTPDDFFASFNEGAGLDMSWYFEELFRGTGTIDWQVRVDQEKVEPPEGMFPAGDGTYELREREPAAEGAKATWTTDVTIFRKGELRLPVLVQVTFADGTQERFTWSREDQQAEGWMTETFTGHNKVVAVEVDPEIDGDRRWYIDTDMSNNQWFDEVDAVAPLRWSERVFGRVAQNLYWHLGIGG